MRQKAGQLMAFDPSSQIEKRRKRRKCGYADKWLSCQKLGVRACRPVEHPCWNLQPSICSRSIQRAAESDIISLVDHSMNANSATKPRMISIKNLAKERSCGRSQSLLYNRRRPHSSLDGSTPDQAYCNPLPLRLAA